MIDGRWVVVGPQRKSGQAIVYPVTDSLGTFDGHLALKRLNNDERAGRFRREIETMQELNHLGIVPIYYVGSDKKDRLYYVMPWMERGSLADYENPILFQGRPAQALQFLAEICDTLTVAHQHNPPIVHRDIKPANILLTAQDRPLIADFGLCFRADGPRLTESHEVTAIRWFGAPELAHGRTDEITPRADVYSVGKLLYWLVTGGGYFDREDGYFADSLKSSFHDDRYRHINQLLRRSIAYNPGSRFADAAEMARHALELVPLFQAGALTRIVAVSGDGQTTACAGILEALVVRLEDAEGNPIADRDVWWEGEGAKKRSPSGVEGMATVSWSPSVLAGEHTVSAKIEHLEPARFRYRVVPGSVSRYVVDGVPSEAQPGSVHNITVHGLDQCGNLVPESGPLPPWNIWHDPGSSDTSLAIEPVAREGLTPGTHAFRLTVGTARNQYAYMNYRGDKSNAEIIVRS